MAVSGSIVYQQWSGEPKMFNWHEKCIFPKCGHLFSYFRIVPGSKREIRCKVASCPTKSKSVIRLYPYFGNNEDENAGPRYFTCSICMEAVTDCENMGVSKCGHVFHYSCAVELYVKKEPWYMCTVPECNEIIHRHDIVKLNLKMKVHKTCEKKLPKQESLGHMMKKFSKTAITRTAAKDLEMKIFKHCIEKWESLKLKDKTEALKLFPFEEKHSTQRLDTSENESTSQMADLIEENAKKILEINELKKTIEDLEWAIQTLEKNVTDREDQIRIESLQKEVQQLNAENEILKKQNEEMKINVTDREDQIRIESLEKEVQQLNAENEILKKQNEEMKIKSATMMDNLKEAKSRIVQIEELLQEPLQNVTAREDEIRIESLQNEVQQLRAENEMLKEQNDGMKTDIEALKVGFPRYEASITAFMIEQLVTEINNS